MKFCRSDGATLEHLEDVPTEILTKRFTADNESRAGLATTVLDTARARTTGDLKPETRYAKSGDINIAYQVLGSGPVDLIYIPGWVSHLEYGWEEPSLARFYRRLASFSRLILFDKRGTGLPDQSTNMPTLEQRMADVRAAMEAVVRNVLHNELPDSSSVRDARKMACGVPKRSSSLPDVRVPRPGTNLRASQ